MSLFPKFFTAPAIATTLVMGATTAAMAGPYSIVWGGGAHLGLGEVPEGNNGFFSAREIFPIMKAHPSGGFYTAP
jgi:hypothetical protein